MNIDKLILKEQKKRKKTNTFSMEMLLEMVEEILEVNFEASEKRSLLLEASGQTLTFSMIPDINISELGWAQGKTPKGSGSTIGSGARQQLEQYLDSIQGETFPEKLASLQAFYQSGGSMNEGELINLGIITGDETNPQQVSKILGYLVFYKTLTTIVTNFNASSAGFSFEAFLGVLLGGAQVPTGGGTIADLTDRQGNYISLKLYAESGVEVGGSFHDLVGDLVEHPMHYLVGMKDFEGEGMEANGSISFYGFDFTVDNVMNILQGTKPESRGCLRLPLDENRQLIDANAATPKSPAPTAKDKDEALKNKIGSRDFWENVKGKVYSTVYDGIPLSDLEREKLMGNDASGEFIFSVTNPDLLGSSGITRDAIHAKVMDLLSDGPVDSQAKRRYLVIASAITRIVKDIEKEAKALRDERTAAVGKLKFANLKTSVEYYNNPERTPDEKKAALLNSYGVLNNKHFSMSRGAVYDVAQLAAPYGAIPKSQKDGVKIGAIHVGSANVQKMLNLCTHLINDSVFKIFQDVKVLTDNVNKFFATGLNDTNAAGEADKAAKSIEAKTSEYAPSAGDEKSDVWFSAGGDTAQPGGFTREHKENKTREDIID